MKLHNKLLHTAMTFALTLGASMSHVQAAELALSDVPLFIKDGVDPNMIVTLDDSGSMAWAFIPDGISGNWDKKRFKSSYYNAMYYNPDTIYTPPKNENGVSYSTSFSGAWHNGFTHALVDGRRKINLENQYRPVYTYYPHDSRQTYLSGYTYAYYYVFDPDNYRCNGYSTDDDCYDKVDVRSQSATDKQNFANWYSFYRTRVLATSSAATLAFQSVNDDVRVAWQNLNRCNRFSDNCRDRDEHTYDSRIRPFTGVHREQFYDWLKYAPANGGTPLRSATVRAGNLLKSTDENSPYAKKPGTTINPMYECRASYHIAMTDGLWNSDTITIGNYDNKNHTTPGGCSGTSCSDNFSRSYGPKTYQKFTPYKDSDSNTLADIVLKQWMEDAQPTIPNQVPVFVPYKNTDKDKEYWDARNDPAEWQHMATYLVSLGLSKVLTNPQYTKKGTFGDDGGYPDLVDGTTNWPAVSSNSSKKPYDLWHAAINGRGEFFGVESPNALVNAFKKIIAGIQERNASASATALDSGVVNGLGFAYHAQFFSDNWSGDLQAFELIAPDYEPAATPSWKAQTQLTSQSATSRIIKMVSDKTTYNGLQDFLWSNMSTGQQALLNLDENDDIDTLGAMRTSYLRGDDSNEGTNFRARNGKKLGDIVHSTPTHVGAPDRIGYDTLEGIDPSLSYSYKSFKENNKTRLPLVYVGANDGMFHAFNASISTPLSGSEHMAFIPSAVFPKLRELSYKSYTHEYFVDGSSATGDVYDPSLPGDDKWRTIIVTSLRGGGKSTFALDITDPEDIKILWQFADIDYLVGNTVDVDLGFTYSKPQIVRLHNGRWGVLIGNGYNSKNHKAVMYVLDAIDGSIIKKFDTGVGSYASPNGLAQPSPVDINGDLIVDYVYAGDLQGNVWRFDLIDTSLASPIHEDKITIPAPAHPRNNAPASKWSIAYGGSPLFTAMDALTPATRQPITTNIVAAPHSYGKGIIAMFGTGKYLEGSDATPDTAHAQSYYGIWDHYILGEPTTTAMLSSITRSNLQEQTLSSEKSDDYERDDGVGGVITETEVTREVSMNEVEWYDYTTTPYSVKKQGWYIDFIENSTDYGELLTTESLIIGSVITFATTVPNTNPCSPGVDRWIWALDIQTGGKTKNAVFDLNNDGKVDNKDLDPDGSVNNSIKTSGLGAVSAVGNTIYINQDSNIDTLKTNPQGDNLRRSWRVIR